MSGCGVYKIVNCVNGKFYIGSAINFQKRWSEHRRLLKREIHFNQHLQSAWKKYGEENFEFLKVEGVKEDLLIEREQFWLDNTRAYERGNGYNICPVAGNTKGRKHSKEARKKMSDSQKSIVRPTGKEHWSYGKERTEEQRKKISETLRKNLSGSKTKLNWGIVKEIRKRFKEEKIRKAELARIYGVDRSQICRIVNNQTWREIGI